MLERGRGLPPRRFFLQFFSKWLILEKSRIWFWKYDSQYVKYKLQILPEIDAVRQFLDVILGLFILDQGRMFQGYGSHFCPESTIAAAN
jgi:hypothetical protein